MPDQSSPLESHAKTKKSIFSRPLLVGCLGFMALGALLIGGGIVWLVTSGKKVITDGIRNEIVTQIEDPGLPTQQQEALKGDNPLSSPCIPPKFVLHGLSSKSKFLAV